LWIVRSYRFERQQKLDRAASRLEDQFSAIRVQDVLNHPVAHSMYKDFLTNEFAVENILFLEAAAQLAQVLEEQRDGASLDIQKSSATGLGEERDRQKKKVAILSRRLFKNHFLPVGNRDL
jgi:hypothetical protein